MDVKGVLQGIQTTVVLTQFGPDFSHVEPESHGTDNTLNTTVTI